MFLYAVFTSQSLHIINSSMSRIVEGGKNMDTQLDT
jgi:hypothetical protein